ncbi:WbqC family protein [Pedobacter sp. L105]|uniref:WbqC family protein n=1 Tax=Pedobacter sp. L105 TaxID=1641871 RepID=UPI00131C988A|nr:WbqC family protein [Pedobacter sp. L105]
MHNLAIFPIFYLPPVSYFSALQANHFEFVLEKEEHFPKQTYRNRATVHSPNGPLDLFLPVIKGSKYHTRMKDVRISYDFKWQRLHWLSLESCYRNSAYFEFYEDELAPFYHKKFEFLFDYNLELLQWIFKQLKKAPELQFTTEYMDDVPFEKDYRSKLHFKDPEFLAPAKPYYQVFEDRNGFLPNMSIVDLLFNQGPQAKNCL